ncbi:hypothetical protein [Amaricoccus macauensis]|uniref:hypothetical protein n=1 Tax=Amaricoccus macauensis TaxID=57001 RepID=UPI003C7AFAAE
MKLAFALTAAIVLVATSAGAQNFKTYGSAGDWEIAINENMGPGCVAIEKFVNPTSQVQLGIDATNSERTGYVAIYVEDADGVEAGEEIPARLELDGETFEGTFMGQRTDGMGGAFVPVNNPDFVMDLEKADALTIEYGDGYKVVADLSDADAALATLRECQDAQ